MDRPSVEVSGKIFMTDDEGIGGNLQRYQQEDILTHDEELQQTLDVVSSLCQTCISATTSFSQHLQQLRQFAQDVSVTLDHKMADPELQAWASPAQYSTNDADSLPEHEYAAEREALMRAKEARAAAARAGRAVHVASEGLARAEAEAAEAEAVAVAARNAALEATHKLQAAREAKRRQEEDVRHQQEEQSRRKEEEEEARRNEQLNLRQADAAKSAPGDSENGELLVEAVANGMPGAVESRNLSEEAGACDLPELNEVQQQDRTETGNSTPETWPRYIYSLDAGDWDTGLGCVLRAAVHCMSREDLDVSGVHSATAAPPLADSEELISNIVHLAPAGPDVHIPCLPFLSVSLPHCAPRLHPGREPVVRMRPLGSRTWKDVPTTDIIFDDIRELKFVETRVEQLGTLAVVLRLKRESVELNRFGGKAMASADSRVTLTYPPKAVQSTANLTMAVQLLDQGVVSEVRHGSEAGGVDCTPLLSASPILHLQAADVGLLRPLVVTMPCPPNPASRPQRPSTGTQRKPDHATDGSSGDQRPSTARPFFTATSRKDADTVVEDEVHVLWREEHGAWCKLTDSDPQQSKKKDIVSLEFNGHFGRLLVLRTRIGTSQGRVERVAAILEHSVLAQHHVQLVLRQHSRDPGDVLLTCTSPLHLERTMRSLADAGYTKGPAPSQAVILREGQSVDIGFRGNMQPVTDFSPRCLYHANIPFRFHLSLAEADRFAQKSFDSYRGFVQVFTVPSAPLRRLASSSVLVEDQDSVRPPSIPTSPAHHGKLLLAELLVVLPKPEPDRPRPLKTAPVILKSDGPVTDELLRHVAQQLAPEEGRRLASLLGVRRTRLQAILRQTVRAAAWQPVYEILLTWSKRLPQSFNRVEVLCGALTAVGRNDVAEEVMDRDFEFRQQRDLSSRESLLNKAFVRIARHEKAVSQWRRLALFLGLTHDQLEAIAERTCSSRERCLWSLQQWKDSQDNTGDAATLKLLSHKLLNVERSMPVVNMVQDDADRG
nr:hypothetical protein BaRGS_018820 [Batillaria attramentaria]